MKKTTNKYSPEVRQRAVRMVLDNPGQHESRWSAILSISAKVRLRLLSKAAEGARCVGGFPPEFLNHRLPTGAGTPASTAASSLESPIAIPRQNRHRVSRCQTGGRPGENNLARVDRSDFRLPVVIYNSKIEVLRRPVESADDHSLTVMFINQTWFGCIRPEFSIDQIAGRSTPLSRIVERVPFLQLTPTKA